MFNYANHFGIRKLAEGAEIPKPINYNGLQKTIAGVTWYQQPDGRWSDGKGTFKTHDEISTMNSNAKAEQRSINAANRMDTLGGMSSNMGVDQKYVGDDDLSKGTMSGGKAAAVGAAATYGVAAMNTVADAAMGDKNFGALSQAIDGAVHGASSALISSGNPYAMAAGAALEAANFITKAGGQTTQGFDVGINSSGYGNIGHAESKSNRDFGAAIGLGGIFGLGKLDRQIRERNEQALMAMKAANIADTIKYEQEARMNSVDDVLQANQIALAGGVDTSLISG